MKNKKFKKCLVVLLTIIMFFCIFSAQGALLNVNAEGNETTCSSYTGNNKEYQDYKTWSKPVYSYLSECSDGSLMLLQYISGANFTVKYYDSDFNCIKSEDIALDLPLFGAFYETDSNYYILSGQNNPDESNEVQVYCITKYDKNWNWLGSCGLNGANTYIPFDAGSARMVSSGNYLLIRTCHEMYKSSDGYHHQANVTIQVDMENMKITDSYSSVMNSSYGYVSHSFNQFIAIEDDKVVAVDHGDAYPRSIVLINYPSDVTTGKFSVQSYYDQCSVTDLVEFDGSIGANYTGASVGGFEISGNAYLVAGNQDIGSSYSYGRNIFIAAKNKSTGEVNINYITDYSQGEGNASTPHFVKIGSDSYMLLWSMNNKVYYTMIDADGNQVGSIYNMDGNLSDCVPVKVGNNLIWYVWDKNTVYFYQINVNSMTDASVTAASFNHSLKYNAAKDALCEENGSIAYWNCEDCGKYFSDKAASKEITDIIVPATGHSWGEWEVTTPATVDEEGVETRVCKNDSTHIETRSISKIANKLTWKHDSKGWWYQDSYGWYPKSEWQKIDGKWYYFKSDGYMASKEWCNGYWLNEDGSWTYQPKGSWKSNSTGWWYEDTSGWYAKNEWLTIDGKRYHFNDKGYWDNK